MYYPAEDADKDMNVTFQRSKRDLNIGFMGAARGSRDRQIELFQNVDEIQKKNVIILKKQVKIKFTFFRNRIYCSFCNPRFVRVMFMVLYL